MNANMSHIMTRTICSLIFGTGLLLVSAADASPHQIEYRPYVAHSQYVYGRTRAFPGWLHRNRDFQRWYSHSRYRPMGHMSWQRLYDIYYFDRSNRWQSHGSYGNVYRDNGHRTYRRQPKRHR